MLVIFNSTCVRRILRALANAILKSVRVYLNMVISNFLNLIMMS